MPRSSEGPYQSFRCDW